MDAIFLDRDGVINADRPDYVRSWEQLRILPGALEALRRLRLAGVPVFVVTNQSAVGRGLMDLAALEEIHRRLRRVVWRAGGEIRDIFYCPHRPEDGCSCRKPKAGLLLQAGQRYGLDLRRCALVGDARTDVQAARAARGPGGPGATRPRGGG
ncbi:MAG: HAD family hydrolase, partial [Thermomicrobiaceae bacterium]|nr:HAD family hydrolase [Thermomicrobiaceae bacterium]